MSRLLSTHQLGLLPNTARTGIKDVDFPKAANAGDPFSSLKKMGNIQMFASKNKKAFCNYISELKVQGIPEVLDLD